MTSYFTPFGIGVSILFLTSLSEGSDDSNFNPSSSPPRSSSSDAAAAGYPSSRRTYLLTQQVSVDPIQDSINLSSETESLTFYSDDDYDDEPTNEQHIRHSSSASSSASSSTAASSVVSSSLLYNDGECFVSSEALMCSGGGGDNMFFPTTDPSFNSPLSLLNSDFDSDDEEEDDDDDDDDDDGHSSMLSNASLRRSRRVSASGSSIRPSPNRAQYSSRASKDSTTAVLPPTMHSSSSSSLFTIRGGGASASQSSSGLGSEFAKRLIVAAIVTLVYEACLGHFFEFLKVVKQTSPPDTSYWSIVQQITSEKGIAGIWDGFVPWGVIQALAKGSVFGLAYAMASSVLLSLADDDKIPKLAALTMAGGIAGAFQGLVLSPTLLLKTRVMTNPIFREKMSLLSTTLQSFRIGFDVVADEGLAALMKGCNVFATKRMFDWSTRFLFADIISSELVRRQGGSALTMREKIATDLMAGFFSTLVTLPLDVLVSKTQDAKKAGESVSAMTLFQEELKDGGWSGIAETYMGGFVARLAHVCCTTVAMKTGTGIVYDALFCGTETSN